MNHQNVFLRLPEMIRKNCRFCCWRKEHRNGMDTKVPYTPTSGNRARSNDVKTFRSFEQALTAYNNSQNTNHPYSGLGICVDGNIGAIDIDHCLDADALFTRFVHNVIVYSRTEIGFAMKCGPVFRERI